MLLLPYVSHQRLISYVMMSLVGFTMLGVYVIVLTWCTTLGFPEYRGNGVPVYRRDKPPDFLPNQQGINELNIQRLHRDLKYSKSSSDRGAKSTFSPEKNSNNVNFVAAREDPDDYSVDKSIDNTNDSFHLSLLSSSSSSASSSDNPASRNPDNTKHRDSMVKRLPQAIIIGVKKGGTRALLEFLRIHPDVRAPGPEPHFFDRHYDKGLDWYRDQMPSTLPGQLTIEKTPSYFVTREVPQRIFNMSKAVKLIVVVRDPVTRAISDYTQAATKRPGMKPFDQMAFIDNSSRIVDTKWAAVRIGVYAKHLERWLKYFPLSQIHFVNGEKLISDPAGEMAKVQDFLGLKRIVTDKHFYLNETRGFPCLKKPEGSGRPHCLGKTKGRQHPRVDLKVMHRLRDFFKPFNAKFYQITGQVFDWN